MLKHSSLPYAFKLNYTYILSVELDEFHKMNPLVNHIQGQEIKHNYHSKAPF